MRTNLLTSEEIAQARESRKWPESGIDGALIVAEAQRWMKYSPTELREMVPPPEVPRAFDVHDKQSPTHSEAILAFGSYPWIIDPDRPYKVISPVDGSAFPTNDFDPKNPGRPEDVSTEPYVDTGWGWKDPSDPHKYWFVAYWAHWFWYSHLVPAAETLAQAYIMTGEQRYARQAAALLDRIADVYPHMEYVTQSRYGTEIQVGTYHGRIVNKVWETSLVRTLARAYDFVFEGMEGDDELEQVTGKSVAQVRANIEQNLLENAARSIFTMDGRIEGNFGMHHAALATIAIVLDNENTEKYLDWVLHATGMGPPPYEGIVPGLTNFIYRDGAPHESAPGYNALWAKEFQTVAELVYRRGIDLYAEYPRLKRLFDLPLRLVMPGNYTPAIGDSGSVKDRGIVGWDDRRYTIAFQRYQDPSYINGRSLRATASDNMSSYGLAMLRRGSLHGGTGLTMYYGRSGGHGHWDRLNIDLFALGHRMTPDLGYPEYTTGYSKKRFGWTSHTLSHNTVMVNEQRQHSKDGGRLQVFAASPRVQFVDARAEEAYPGVVDRYQRAVALIDVSANNAYAVDIFRVRGGNQHDYSLHGPDGEVTFHNLELSPVQERGTLAGEDVPFGYWYDAPQFEAPGYSGTYVAYQGSGYSYLTQVQRGTPQGVWYGQWRLRDDRRAHLRATFLPEADMEVVVADGEPPRNKVGNPPSLKYILARRHDASAEGLDSTFITILEPYRDEPFLAGVTRLDDGTDGAEGVVALAIERTDGVDYVFQSPDPTQNFTAADAHFKGRLGVVSRDGDGALRFAYLLGGGVLRQGDVTIEATGSYEGEIVAIDFAARRVSLRFDRALEFPDALVGQRMVIFNDYHATEYIVEEVSPGQDGLLWLTLGETDFLTAIGELGSVSSVASASQSVLSSRTPLLLGAHHRGQWLINPETGEGGRIVEFGGDGRHIRIDNHATGLRAGSRFEIYDFGIGDRVEIGSAVYVAAGADGEYDVQSNVPVQLRLSDGRLHELGPGEHRVSVPVPKVVWHAPLPAGTSEVRGQLPLAFSVEIPEGLNVLDVSLRLNDQRLYAGPSVPAPGEVVVDTRAYPDGEHTLYVTVTDSLNRRFTEALTLAVDNWWEEVDDLRPPIASGWFTADFTKTSDRSKGWEYQTGDESIFYGDKERLRRIGDELEYLVWSAPRLHEFNVKVYARKPNTAVNIDGSLEGTTWQRLDFSTEVEGPNAAGWYALHLWGVIDDLPGDDDSGVNHFRISVPELPTDEVAATESSASEAVTASELQVGQVTLRGRQPHASDQGEGDQNAVKTP